MLDNRIFREYDIRGVYGKDLTDEAAFLIGRAFSEYLRRIQNKSESTISIGRDVRLSSASLRNSLVRGLLESNVAVIDLGVCPTPLQYYSLYRLETDGGVMITGSHNPPEYNGFKMSAGKQTLYGDDIQEIRRIIERGVSENGWISSGVETFNIIDDYIDFVTPQFPSFEGIRVVVDSGNGTGGLVVPRMLKSLGAEVIELFSEPDGRFPNHHPDPVVLDNVKTLRETVVKEHAHLGIGFDGDADRIGVVDEQGEPVWGDSLMIIFARDVLRMNPGAAVIGEVKCSQTMYDDIVKQGGRAIMWKTGHSLIKKKMKDEAAILAGEMSGHIFFADKYYGYDDAIYAALRLIEIMKKTGKPYGIRKLLHGIPVTYSTPEIRYDCPDDKKFRIVEAMKESFKVFPHTAVDGIRIQFPEGWALIRASNTQPTLVMRYEARTQEALRGIEGVVKKRLAEITAGI